MKKNGTTIRRGKADHEKNINQVMHQASYPAKQNSKENTPKGQHLWIETKLPKK